MNEVDNCGMNMYTFGLNSSICGFVTSVIVTSAPLLRIWKKILKSIDHQQTILKMFENVSKKRQASERNKKIVEHVS